MILSMTKQILFPDSENLVDFRERDFVMFVWIEE